MKFISRLIYGDQNSTQKQTLLTNEDYKQKGQEILNSAWSILNSSDDWKLEKQTAQGDKLYTKYIPGYGKFFKLTGEVNFPPKRLLTELYNKIENSPTWNPTITESHLVQAVDDTTDVNYLVSTDAAGGLVRGREFVNLRQMGIKDGCYISAGAAIEHPDVPRNSRYIRGENGPNCWVMRPIPGVSDRCTFQWLMNTRLNGWLPQYLVDSALSTVMFDYIGHIRSYGNRLREQGEL